MLYARKLGVAALIFLLGLAGGYVLSAYRFRISSEKAHDTVKKLGPWQASFTLPASVRVPLQNPILVLDVKPDEMKFSEKLKVTITNLTDRLLTVRLEVYGYNSMDSRQSGHIESFSIKPREKLPREFTLETYEGNPMSVGLPASRKAASYALSVEIGE